MHPLRGYPGPRLWAASRLPWNYFNLQGNLATKILALHQQYGPVVRIAPDELSYTTGTAWKKIYGQRFPAEFEKCLDGRGIAGAKMPDPNVSGIVTAPHERHARLRRAILPAFSDRALKEQEGFLQLYTDKLVAQLRRACRAGSGGGGGGTGATQQQAVENMSRWYALLAFDVISDLAFGQPAGCLDNADQPWLQVLGQRARSIVWYQFGTYYGLSSNWLTSRWLVPRSALAAVRKHGELTTAKVTRRLEQQQHGPDGEGAGLRKDFMSYIVDKGDEKLSKMELVLMASSFIVAGSGTSSSALTGITFFLGRNRDKLRRLVEEIRGAFPSQPGGTAAAEITIEATARLPYLRAVIEEGMRLYPPSPSTLPRFVPGKGEVIEGKWVPGGTAVGVHQLSAGRMEGNFKWADQFIPERWMAAATGSKEAEAGEFRDDDRAATQPFSYGPRNCIGQK